MKPKLWKVKRKIVIWEESTVVAETKYEAFELTKTKSNNWQEKAKNVELSLNYLQIIERDVLEGN